MTVLRTFCQLTPLLLGGLLIGMASASPLTSTNLMFTIDGADLGIVPIALEDGSTNPVEYDLASGQISLTAADVFSGQYDDPLFCFDFNAGTVPPVSLYVRDANGHSVLDGLTISSMFQYFPVNDEIRLAAQSGTKCFYRGVSSNQFGLFGQPAFQSASGGSPTPGDSVFGSEFIGTGMVLSFENVPAFASVGSEVVYRLTLSNPVGRTLENIGLQELFPANGDVFDATLSDGSFVCSGSNSCSMIGPNGSGSLRFQGFDVFPGETLELEITRTVAADADVGSVIKLYAGAVAADSMLQPYDVAKAEITVVGAGDSLVVSADPVSVDQTATVTVTALDAQQNPVPNIDISVDNAGGLSIAPVGSTVSGANGEVKFYATAPNTSGNAGDYTVQFTSMPAGIIGSGQVEFLAGAPTLQIASVQKGTAIADGVDQVIARARLLDARNNRVSGHEVIVTDNGGLTSLPPSVFTNADGDAIFTATSLTLDSYAFKIAPVGAPGLESSELNVSFTAGEPAAFEFARGPLDTPVENSMDRQIVVRVLDANGNRVDDVGDLDEIELHVYAGQRQEVDTQPVVCDDEDQLFPGCVARFSNPNVSTLSPGFYTFTAIGYYNGEMITEVSSTFEIYVPD